MIRKKRNELIPTSIFISKPYSENYNSNGSQKQLDIQNDKLQNQAHTTEIRFLIFIYEGEHFYNWFLQTLPLNSIYQFICQKLKENNEKFAKLKESNIQLFIHNDQTRELRMPKPNYIQIGDPMIKDRIPGSTHGRTILDVKIINF